MQLNFGHLEIFLRPAQRAVYRPSKPCLLSEVADLQNKFIREGNGYNRAPSPGPHPSVLSDAFLRRTAVPRSNEQEEEEENKSSIYRGGSTPPAAFACTASIRSQRGNITASARAEGEKQTCSTCTKKASEAGANTSLCLAPFSFPRPPLLPSISPPSLFPSTCDMSRPYFHVLAPLIVKANTGRCVLMIVSGGHLSSVKLLSSEEVNTPSELWLF